MVVFFYDDEKYFYDEIHNNVYDKNGCFIKYNSIQDFITDAIAEGGADNLSGWEY